ncbi:MAG: hypothetical protein ACRDBO_18930 [Lachnospiraceae bacterium]
MSNSKEVISGNTYGNFLAKWSWKSANGEHIWKCSCLLCGNPAYVKEKSLLHKLIDNCGCNEKPI